MQTNSAKFYPNLRANLEIVTLLYILLDEEFGKCERAIVFGNIV